MKNALKVLLATLLVACFTAQMSVFAAPQMMTTAEEANEILTEYDKTEPVYEETEDIDDEQSFEADEDFEAEVDAELQEAEQTDEVAVLFTESGDVIYLAKKIAFDTTKIYLPYGGSKALITTITPEETTDKSITWASLNESVATVDSEGVLTAGEVAGSAKITATTVNGKKATCTVYVGAPAEAVEFTSLKATSIAVDKSLTLKAKAFRNDKTKPVSTAVTFEIISGEDFATIDEKGKVKGVAHGEVVVRARAQAGTEDAYADVTINVCVPATKVTLNTTKTAMALGQGDIQLEAVMLPEENTDKLFWSSSKEEIATVDENGVVTAHSTGSVKITATSGSGKKATCSITIGAPADAVEFTSLKSTSLAVGKTLSLKAKAFCEDGSKPVSTAVVFEIISGSEYVEFDSEKGKLEGTGIGEVVVRARAQAGTEDAYADVTINVCVPATKVTLNTTKTAMALGQGDIQLEAVMLPEENTDKLFWSSSKEEIATVDENGVVTAHSTGSVKITATSGSGKKATCSITIGAPADAVEFTSLKSTSLAVGKTLSLKAKAFCAEGGKPVSTAVTFEIVEGSQFAEIDEKGKLTGTATGEVVVRARAQAGTEDAYADVTINVCIPITSIKFEQSKVTLALGETIMVQKPILSPEENTDTLNFYSDDESVVEIDEFGNLIPVSVGTAKIYAESGSGKKAYYTVNVEYPQDKLVLAVSNESVRASADKVTLDILVVNNPGIAGVTLNLEFDDSVFEIASVTDGDFSEFEIVEGMGSQSPYKILAYNVSDVTGDGTLVSVTFNILEDAEPGMYDIAVKSNSQEDNLMVVDQNGEVIEHLAFDGIITLR